MVTRIFITTESLAARAPVFSITDYGAVGDGVADDVLAIQEAIDAAQAAGGGTVLLGNGTYRITGPLVFPSGVSMRGHASNHAGVSVIKCDSSDACLKIGQWTGSENLPGRFSDFTVDGNETGDVEGLMQLQCVTSSFDSILIKDGAGHGLVLDAAQNCLFTSVDIDTCGDQCLVLTNGCGGNLFSRCEIRPSVGGLLATEGAGGNGYPFGPAHNEFHHCIFEAYVNVDSLVLLECGATYRFTTCGFSANDVNIASEAQVIVSQEQFPGLSTFAEFDGCNFNGGSGLFTAIKEVGIQRVLVRGETYVQQSADLFVQDGSIGIFMLDGTLIYGDNVTNNFVATGGGSLLNWYVRREQGVNYELPSTDVGPLSVKRKGDDGGRFFIDRDGAHGWQNGADYTIRQAFDYDSAGDNLRASTLKVNGRIVRTPTEWTFSSGPVILDAKASSVHRLIITGATTISSMTVTGHQPGAILTVMIATDAAQAITWATNMKFVGGSPPASPGAGACLMVTFMYEELTGFWLEQHRSLT